MILLLVLAVSAAMPVSYGKTSQQIYDDAIKTGDDAFVYDRFADAAKIFQSAVPAAEKLGMQKAAILQFKLGSSYEGAKDWRNALGAFEKSLLFTAKSGDVSGNSVVTILNGIAHAAIASGKPLEVERICNSALEATKNAHSGRLAPVNFLTSDLSLQMIELYKKNNLNDALIRHSEQMIALHRTNRFSDTGQLARYNEAIGDAYVSSGKPKEAEKYYRVVLALIGQDGTYSKNTFSGINRTSSKVVRHKLIAVYEKTGRFKEAANTKKIAENWKKAPFENKKFYELYNKTYKNPSRTPAEQLAALKVSGNFLADYFEDELQMQHSDLFCSYGTYYGQIGKPALAEDYFRKALACSEKASSAGAPWASGQGSVPALMRLSHFYKTQKRMAEAKKLDAQIDELREKQKRRNSISEIFANEEVSGPVQVSISPSNAAATANSRVKFEIKVTNVKNYRPIWILKTDFGKAVEDRDHRFGRLRPGLLYRSRNSTSGHYKDINVCEYTAPLAALPGSLKLEVQILKRSNDDVLATVSCPIRFAESEVSIHPTRLSMKTGESMKFVVTAKNVTDDLVLAWTSGMEDENDPEFKNGNATLQGLYKLRPGRYGDVKVTAVLRSKFDGKVVKEVSAIVQAPPDPNPGGFLN
jgi:tetratricopeptide (TPR) repeat protein